MTTSNSRRTFIKQSSLLAAGVYTGTLGRSAKSYGHIIGANDLLKWVITIL